MSVANSVSLIGRLTRDPYVRELDNGSKVVLMTLAVERDYKSKDGETITDFVNFKAFVRAETDGLGPWAYTSKGMLIAVNGAIRSRRWEDTQGATHFDQEIVADSVRFLESRKAAESRKNKAGMTVSEYNQRQSAKANAAPTEQAPAQQEAQQDEQLNGAEEPPFN